MKDEGIVLLVAFGTGIFVSQHLTNEQSFYIGAILVWIAGVVGLIKAIKQEKLKKKMSNGDGSHVIKD